MSRFRGEDKIKGEEGIAIPLLEMIMCLSDAMDLVSTVVNGHHKRVAYIASSIAAELGMFEEEQRHLIIAGALHDVGAFSLQDRLDALNFEVEDFSESLGLSKHAELGYRLIKHFKPFDKIAPFVRYHHVYWQNGAGSEFENEEIPLGSHILHLADRIDVLINSEKEILSQTNRINKLIEENKGNQFKPELVEAYLNLSNKESFWFDIISPATTRILAKRSKGSSISLNIAELGDLAKLFSQVIDFRSRFTASHSSGVAASAQALSKEIGLSELARKKMKIAGHLHDLGKLAVPTEILEKEGKVTNKEFNLIKKHVYYTYHTLDRVKGLEEINKWASFHHERLDGTGYPFHHWKEDLPLGSRIMAVADVFTAITEDRPYRKGMDKDKALEVLQNMAQNSALDSNVVTVLADNYERINIIRQTAQKEEIKEYERFWQEG
ncbi:HD-GYP domain-containing protein [Sporohalobacter salinus]|uniref:HD-GYP domain-containing protein n=1 Tax=Sporohalobacter salinus TaxID=1494606 RepID=UPI001EF8180C|nr:HD domain-containing phosphohydrolase [Sporohalobacter salinus]MBM7623349.1 HD-GYP domain-containing protein (c-di-GMP phosphodiesterase class II) [Sporohalobacter salinus]